LFSIQQQPLNPGLIGSPLLDHLKLFLCLECGTQCDPVVAASLKGHEEDERGRGKRRKTAEVGENLVAPNDHNHCA
jgi:hypothetical protein